MRARNLKPSLFKNEELADLGPYAVILFQGLWCMADREGRLEDRPRRIGVEILPYYEDIDVDELLTALDQAGFIDRYTHGSDGFIQVTNFTKHQNPHKRESDSSIPAPDKHSASTVKGPDEHRTRPADSGYLNPDPGSLTAEGMSEVADAPRTPPYEPEHFELAVHLDTRIQEHNPKAKPASTRQLESWANDVRLMVQRDEHATAEILQVIEWCQESEFWRSNILSMGKLREKFPTLWAQMHERKNGQRSPPRNQPDYRGIDEFGEALAELQPREGRGP